MNYPQFSSESVSEGHPDKVCDQVSDAVLDAAYTIDPKARVAVETLVTDDKLVMAGEVTINGKLDFEAIARQKIAELDYTDPALHFTDKSNVEIYIHQQSPDIAQGVNTGGAGDQGMMFGYACKETPELMPLPISMAHRLCQKMDELQRVHRWIRPDGKSQVTARYDGQTPVSIEKVVLAKPVNYQSAPADHPHFFYENVIVPVLSEYGFSITEDKMILNGTGKWEIGGPFSDTGVTGRKIVVDTYGGMGRIGGGCFSGKDTTKVDRSAAYAARYIAKNIVAAGLADRCEVQLAYAIGQVQPVGKAIETFGTSKSDMKIIEDFAWKLLDLSVAGINDGLNLRVPMYQKTARYGHFGNKDYPWEQIKG
ncbi:MAG: methionine adenosyltransferase [Candidatus Shapirobacteria bacterium]|jgi:S-adenosylmethionine synthetase